MALPIGSDLDLNNEVTIINVPPPVNGTDVVNKDYVDTLPGDNLGNHTATTDLQMSGNEIIGADSVGTNSVRSPLSSPLNLVTTGSFIDLFSNTNTSSLVSSSRITLDRDSGITFRSIGSNSLQSTLVLDPSLLSYSVDSNEIFRADEDGANFPANLPVSFNGQVGTSGQILQSTGTGAAPIWVNPATPTGDNLGNHIATINLDMSGNDIIDANLAQINTINPPTGNAVLVRAVNNNIVIRSEDNSASNQNSTITLNQDNNIDIRAISGAGNTSNFFLTPSQLSYNISRTAIFSASSSGFNILPNTALLANFDPGASGEVLQSNGAGVAPSWVVPSINSSIDDLSDVDISTLAPVDNSTLYWDGTNYVPTNDVLFNTPNCIVDFTNEDGGDVCNTQYNSSSSAFWLGRKANGSKVAPTGVLANERITGFAAGAYDGGIFYIGSEVVFHATENQNGTHGGQDIRFAVTPSGTKARFEALRLEDDGTLSIRNNANYENLVTNDDDIPNKKYVDDAVASAGGGLPFYAFAERTTSQSTNTTSLQYLTFNFTAPTDGIYKVSWNALLRYTSASNNIRARCQLDNSVNITNPGGDGWIEYETKDAGTDIRDTHGSTRTFFLAAGTHTLDFDFGRGSGNNTAWCYYATMDVQLKVI